MSLAGRGVAAGGTCRGLGPLRVRDGAAECEGRPVHVHGKFAEGAGADRGAGAGAVPEHRGGDVFSALQAGVLAGGEPRDRGCNQRRRPGPALDWHDGAEAGEVDVCALAGAEDPLPRGYGRRGVRLLRRHRPARPALVAKPRAGVALPSAQGAAAHVAALRGGECEVLEECGTGEARNLNIHYICLDDFKF